MNGKKDLELKYLKLLSEKYPTIASASTEIINLQSIINLPKGTEHILSDIHGESEQFFHVLKNGSGAVRDKIEDEFGTSISAKDKKQLATIIYYPEEKLSLLEKEETDLDDFYKLILGRLIRVARLVQMKYTRSKVRKSMPEDFRYIMEELIYVNNNAENKREYYKAIINTIVKLGRAKAFAIAISNLIQNLVIDHLHIVGDIFDRGPGAPFIMDKLVDYHSVDVQWGNHDVLWMGAGSGNQCCIATVIRICARYGNIDTLEDDYGINMMPLANFAQSVYGDDPCELFKIKTVERENNQIGKIEEQVEMKMQKAISVIQFKLEGQMIMRHPEFHMEDRLLLDKVDYEKGTINLGGTEYKLLDTFFPTIDPANPYELTPDEAEVIERLTHGFMRCEKLQRHINFLFNKGSLYLAMNNNLYYHGCIPLHEDGTIRTVTLGGKKLSGKSLYDYLEANMRKGFYMEDDCADKRYGVDLFWYTWTSPDSPVFGKDKMATYERYFLAEEETHKETKDPYYRLIEDSEMSEQVCDRIMSEFGMDPKISHIVNGHMPVKIKKGENPIKANGKLLIIDGGFSKAYQKTTGIAGYTLVYNSYGLKLVQHTPFTSLEQAIIEETDIHSDSRVVEKVTDRIMVADTDAGKKMKEYINDLESLLEAYRTGILRAKDLL